MKCKGIDTLSEESTLLHWHNWCDKVRQWYYHGTTGLLLHSAHYLELLSAYHKTASSILQ